MTKRTKKKVLYKNKEYIIEAKGDVLVVNGKEFHTKLEDKSRSFFKVTVDDKKFNIEIRGNEMYLDGEKVENFSVVPYFPQLKKQKQLMNSQKEIVKAPIPGKIVQILIKEGDSVTKDQEIFILEAMKMRNRILSSINGVVKKIHVKENDAVNQDQKLAIIEN
ncbi:MAG: biotin/lipoyl-containing protein [Candidatus Heimdallarchaeaceae archaeon]